MRHFSIGKAIVAAVITLGAGSSVAQIAPSTPTAIAECRLSFEQAEITFGKMTPIFTNDYSDDYADDFQYGYAPASIRPFGMQATAFSRNEYDGDDGQDHSFVTTLTSPYDRAMKAMLRGSRATTCTASGAIGSRMCTLAAREDTGKYKHRIVMKVEETATGSTLRCIYFD